MKFHYKIILLLLLMPMFIKAQSISGKVMDKDGAVIGASVMVEPGKAGTITDMDGNYSLNLSPGTYTVTVTDANFCQVSKSIVIEETQFSIHPIVKNVTCNGAQDGSISLNVIGGVPPVTLIWDDNVNAGSTRNRLNAGTYTVHLSDASCSFTKSFTILEPLPMDATSMIKDAFDSFYL